MVISILTISLAIDNFAQGQSDEIQQPIPKWLADKGPLEQYHHGVSSNIVVCQDLQLVIKASDDSPACVKQDTAAALIERGWAKNTPSTVSGLLEQNTTTYDGIDSNIDVKTDAGNSQDSIHFQVFFPNGTSYRTDAIPSTEVRQDGYYKYHVDTRLDDTTNQEFKVIITYNNDSTSMYIPTTSGSNDIFGVKEIYATKKDGAQWYMNDDNILDDPLFFTGPDSDPKCNDVTTCMQLYKNPSDDSWHAKRINVPENEGTRMVVKSPPNALWLNTEMTGYYKLQNSIHYPQEFTHVARSGSPHVSICDGYSYYSSITYDGNVVEIQKSLYHAGDASSYSETFVNSGITTPLSDRWIGFKTMTYNIENNTAVKFEIWIDDQDNNNWKKIFEKVDTGWPVPGDPADYGCKNLQTGAPMKNNDIISWGGTEQQFRADNAEFDFKKLSIREIEPPTS